MKLKLFFTCFAVVFCINNVAAQMASFAPLVDRLLPSVVSISTTTKETDNAGKDSFSKSTKQALGSGFIIDKAGFIVTNNHVVENAENIKVKLFNNEEYIAKVIGVDKKTDIAIIKIETSLELVPALYGNSEVMRIGDWILAIGNPFGFGGSVTAGIVSAKFRDIESGPYDSFIQTDASINQGSSGGPMFNMSGEVIGINTAIFSETGISQGVGFAFPINVAKFVITEIINKGVVERGWIGIKIQPNLTDASDKLGQGVLVSSITENSPAKEAGVIAGDIIIKVDDIVMDNTKNLSRIIAETSVGQDIKIELLRDNKKIIKSLIVKKMPEKKVQEKLDVEVLSSDKEFVIGINVVDLSTNAESQGKGVVIDNVVVASDAANKGLKIGDVIIQVDKKDVFDSNDFNTYIDDAKRENLHSVLLLVKSDDDLHLVAIKLEDNKKNEN